MRSEIRDSNGHRYWLYIEDFASDEPPRIEIDGKEFTGTYGPEVKAVLERVRTLCGALEPWKETEEVKDLEKQLDTTLTIITAGGTS